MPSIHSARIEWARHGQAFTDGHYSRRHAWQFDGGASVGASSSPYAVPLPWSDAACVDPEVLHARQPLGEQHPAEQHCGDRVE